MLQHLHAVQVCNCTCNMVKKIINAAILQLFLREWGRMIVNQILSPCAAGVEYWLHHTDPMTLSGMKTHPGSRITRHSMSLLMPVTYCRVCSWQFPTSSGFSQPELGIITFMPFCKILQEPNEGHYILANLYFFFFLQLGKHKTQIIVADESSFLHAHLFYQSSAIN